MTNCGSLASDSTLRFHDFWACVRNKQFHLFCRQFHTLKSSLIVNMVPPRTGGNSSNASDTFKGKMRTVLSRFGVRGAGVFDKFIGPILDTRAQTRSCASNDVEKGVRICHNHIHFKWHYLVIVSGLRVLKAAVISQENAT